jgi:4-hydroxy-tetrahydrodipicolinate reductase
VTADGPATIRTAHLGLGPIGLAVVRSVAARPWARVSSAVDVRPDLIGCDVGDLAGIGAVGVKVAGSLDASGPPGSADVVLHCTGSHLERETDRILAALAWGAGVVSSCEELAYPWFHHPTQARRIDDAAREAGRTVLATGINPGFAMDALALCMSAVSERVDRVEVHRVVDAATRRGPLQQKVGAGIEPAEFEARRAAGSIGHVGLVESVALIGAGLGWSLDAVEETLEPVLATATVATDVVSVRPGQVAGIRQVAVGRRAGEEVIRLHLDMYVGASDPGDHVVLVGSPTIRTDVSGLHGDVSTAAILANAAGSLGRLRPGLTTVLDLIPLRAAGPAGG